MPPVPRVVSMVPAATEIVAALGMTDALAAVSHDCDYPAEVRGIPSITYCEIHGADLSSADVERWVERTLAERGTLYTVDDRLLRELAPDVILTQQLCDVCAPAYGSIAQLAATLDPAPEVVNLEPESFDEILSDIRRVADLLQAREAGDAVIARLRRRVETVRNVVAAVAERPRVVLLEWTDPLYGAGHWNPELVAMAGGREVLGASGRPARRAAWGEVVDADPEVLVVAPCGNPLERTLAEIPELARRPGWNGLAAVRSDRVFAVDGTAHFSRPGPRIVDSLELLAGALHPDLFPQFRPDARPADEIVAWP